MTTCFGADTTDFYLYSSAISPGLCTKLSLRLVCSIRQITAKLHKPLGTLLSDMYTA